MLFGAVVVVVASLMGCVVGVMLGYRLKSDDMLEDMLD